MHDEEEEKGALACMHLGDYNQQAPRSCLRKEKAKCRVFGKRGGRVCLMRKAVPEGIASRKGCPLGILYLSNRGEKKKGATEAHAWKARHWVGGYQGWRNKKGEGRGCL